MFSEGEFVSDGQIYNHMASGFHHLYSLFDCSDIAESIGDYGCDGVFAPIKPEVGLRHPRDMFAEVGFVIHVWLPVIFDKELFGLAREVVVPVIQHSRAAKQHQRLAARTAHIFQHHALQPEVGTETVQLVGRAQIPHHFGNFIVIFIGGGGAIGETFPCELRKEIAVEKVGGEVAFLKNIVSGLARAADSIAEFIRTHTLPNHFAVDFVA